MKIALAQMQMSNDIESNYQKSIKLIREAVEKRAQLVMFPEMDKMSRLVAVLLRFR